MSIEARTPREGENVTCSGCAGTKHAPTAAVVTLGPPADLHPALKVARDALALGREHESEQIMREFNESGEPAHLDRSVQVVLCQECGRDAANAIGFMCVREGGWSKLEPRKPEGCAMMGEGAVPVIERIAWAQLPRDERRRRLSAIMRLSVELARVRESTEFSTRLAELAIESVIEGDWKMVEEWAEHFTFAQEDEALRQKYVAVYTIFGELLLQALRAEKGVPA